VFFSPGTRALSQAANNLGQQSQQLAVSENLTPLNTSAGVTFASASAVADPINTSASQNSNAMLSGCNCEASAVGQTLLQKNFIITGGTGNVDVHFSGLLVMMQTVMTDIEQQLSETVTLQFNTEYRFDLLTSASSLVVNQAPAEIPEPATVVLLVSDLGFMAGLVRRRRNEGEAMSYYAATAREEESFC
jgi:hypothetical protein